MSEPIYGRVALIGLGLIASSMFWAMKRHGNLAGTVAGYARSDTTRDTARHIGLCDTVCDTLAEAVEEQVDHRGGEQRQQLAEQQTANQHQAERLA